MHYNLLNYRNSTAQCTESTNNGDKKDGYLSIIAAHIKPDVITVNEMGANWLNPNKILTKALNVDGVTHFDQAEFTNNSFSSLTNMLFFNTEKLVLKNQETIAKDKNNQDLVRVVDVYNLYYKNDEALQKGDTIFITFLAVHLKAGSTTDDQNERALCTEAIMNYLSDHKAAHSYLLSGDFNVQSNSETAYKNLTATGSEDIRYYDPVDAPATWNNNSNYTNLHTQSTHVSDTRGGCFSSGGMDDRFDFILVGKEVLNNTYDVKYLDGSYHAVGQDSRRFNSDVVTPSNNDVPADVADALYNMSDHLPVTLKLVVKKSNSSVQPFSGVGRLMIRQLPDQQLEIRFPESVVEGVRLLDLSGRTVMEDNQKSKTNTQNLEIRSVNPGVYIVEVRTQNRGTLITKIIITQ